VLLLAAVSPAAVPARHQTWHYVGTNNKRSRHSANEQQPEQQQEVAQSAHVRRLLLSLLHAHLQIV
jgi:H2-forming N5,N10-methylenetetrahydromethanopterin dehydrogenase-like enzyme